MTTEEIIKILRAEAKACAKSARNTTNPQDYRTAFLVCHLVLASLLARLEGASK